MSDYVGDLRIKNKEGDTYIAASRRADGTWRKARRVKDGYIPQDEQPRYEARLQRELASRQKYPVGWTPTEVNGKKSAHAAATPAQPTTPVAAISRPNAAITPRDHISKKIGNLNKKLRDIQTLENKIESGELKNPEKTQLEKIARKKTIEDEIENLLNQLQEL